MSNFAKKLRAIGFSIMILILTVSQFGWAVNSAAAQTGDNPEAGPVHIRWFVGIGTGTDPMQIATEQEVVADFNASQPDIVLSLEIVPFESAKDTLKSELTAGNAPDIVGPVGWAGANEFRGQWLDLSTLNGWASYDTAQFPTNLLNWYNTEEGQVALPFLVYPTATYYNPALFDAASLNYPPAHYGDSYVLDGNSLTWDWDTVAQVAKRLTLDNTGKNSTQVGFDKTHVTQYGFSPFWQSALTHFGSYWQSGTLLSGTPGSYTATTPAAWKAAAHWNYDGMWGSQPFIANGPDASSPTFGSGNVFNSGKLGMTTMPSWYTCCLIGDFVQQGNTFQLGALPSYNGQVAGRVDADTFRILSASKHPEQAFIVLQYLLDEGADKLLTVYGSGTGAFSAIPAKQQATLNRLASRYPFVTQTSWDVLVAGLAYPDDPSAESYLPHMQQASTYIQTVSDTLYYQDDLNVDNELATMESGLQTIFNKKYKISGNTGVPGAILSYNNGGPKTVTASSSGYYQIMVPSDWSGTITPSKPGRTFAPISRTYHLVSQDWATQYFSQTATFESNATQDGWILESAENSNTGASVNATSALYLGDNNLKKQYRGMLSFSTGTLPDTAVITGLTLKIKKNTVIGGGDPVSIFQGLMTDIKTGYFGTLATLQAADFQATSSKTLGPITPALASNWYSINLINGKDYINQLATSGGLTQIRLRFKLDDNNNAIANYLSLFSGDATATNRPQLVVTYYVP